MLRRLFSGTFIGQGSCAAHGISLCIPNFPPKPVFLNSNSTTTLICSSGSTRNPAPCVLPTSSIASIILPASLTSGSIAAEQKRTGASRGGNTKHGYTRSKLTIMRRKQRFDHQWKLEIQRPQKGPITPHFTEGTPIELLKGMNLFNGTGVGPRHVKRKEYKSLKRGR